MPLKSLNEIDVMSTEAKSATRVAIVGLGPIGRKVAEALDRGIDGLVLAAVAVQNPEKHQAFLSGLGKAPPVLPIADLVDVADIVIECAPAKLLPEIVKPFVSKGKTAIVLSAGALLFNEDLVALAKQNGGQIVVPTGALIGPRRGDRSGRRQDQFGEDGDAQAGEGPRRRALYRREQDRHREHHRTDEDFRGHGARSRQGLSRQSQCRRRAVACRRGA